jgi:hypothetical protein
MKKIRLLTALAVLALAFTSGGIVMAGKKPPKPCPNCPSTIVIGGKVCTLEACGFDCVYTCPL